MPPILKIDEELNMETRAKNKIPNSFSRNRPDAGKQIEVTEIISKYTSQMLGCQHRTRQPDPVYNCHGLVFASRRTNIIEVSAISMILKDDGYIKISDVSAVLPGDIILYRAQIQDGAEIEHSGIVVRNDPLLPRIPWILSKLGEGHEMIHPYNVVNYSLSNIEYYRVQP